MAQEELSRNVRSDNNNAINNTNIPSIIVTAITCPPPPLSPYIDLFPGHAAAITDYRGTPPPYDAVIGRNAPPPSYDSLFGRIETRKICNEIYEFILSIVIFLLSSIGCMIIFMLSIALPISMVIIGGIYLYDCPQGEYIPVYLLVEGSFGIFKQLLSLSATLSQYPEDGNDRRFRQSPTFILINCFLLGWFIIGSIWVYKEYEPNYDPSLGKYCNKTLYLFAFWLITIGYTLIGAMAVVYCISAMTKNFKNRV